ncbi:secretin N-terminal domain-containing protein [Sulfurirhabdus autotrophica]|uniref:General secretion pathway protein D n=1 Tax=Sulfurirhabdus autotrophica TaxID=1706046 RepID=A0A4R3YG67_9PROT|nr:cohesin domain-containing protein [Sulfurirhabdus autotrophica]TCV89533.1 general secretion pathway protein D [Sulfurirhabdus autotrophica]
MKRYKNYLVTALIAILISGCASDRAFREGNLLLSEGKYEEGISKLQAAAKDDPNNAEIRAHLFRSRDQIINRLLVEADSLREKGKLEEAEAVYHRVQGLDENHPRVQEGLNAIQAQRRQRLIVADAETLFNNGNVEAAQEMLRPVLQENKSLDVAISLQQRINDKNKQDTSVMPALKSRYKKPVSLEFRDANLRSVFEVLSRTAGINFIFDKDVRPDLKTTLFVKDSSIEDVINLLVVTNQLDKRILNENTVLIYPNTPAKTKDYQELVLKSFYLGNADVKQTLNMIKTLLKTRDVFIDEKLNLLMMRDTPEVIRLAEKLIAAQDKAEPEVMLDVEVLEVKRSKLTELGIQYPNQFTALNLTNSNTVTTSAGAVVATTPSVVASQFTVDSLRSLNGSKIGIPSPVLNLRKEDSDTNLLANPRIRVKNREKAKIHIGDKVPVITTTSTANVGISESVSYLDVGLKLDVEPNVFLDNEVGIKVGLEVSNIVREIKSSTGTLTYQVGTRNAVTALRLKDGETQVLAGLINDEDRASASKLPGLGDLPLFGHLFSSHRDEHSKTEIILLITPHVIRNLVRPEFAITEFTSGTESSIGAAPLSLSSAAKASVPMGVNASVSAVQQTGLSQVPQSAPSPANDQEQNGTPVQLNLNAPTQAPIGKNFTLNVNASGLNGVKQVAFEINYDPAKLDVVDSQAGLLMKMGSGQTDYQHSGEGTGHLQISISRNTPASGSGNLATVTFRPLAGKPGATQLGIVNPTASDISGSSLPSNVPAARNVTIVP